MSPRALLKLSQRSDRGKTDTKTFVEAVAQRWDQTTAAELNQQHHQQQQQQQQQQQPNGHHSNESNHYVDGDAELNTSHLSESSSGSTSNSNGVTLESHSLFGPTAVTIDVDDESNANGPQPPSAKNVSFAAIESTSYHDATPPEDVNQSTMSDHYTIDDVVAELDQAQPERQQYEYSYE